MILEKCGDWILLVTFGDETVIPVKIKHSADVWIHNSEVCKNKSFLRLKLGDKITSLKLQVIRFVLNHTPNINDWREKDILHLKLDEIRKEIGLY